MAVVFAVLSNGHRIHSYRGGSLLLASYYSIDLLVGHVVCAVDLPRCLPVVRTGLLSIASLTVIKRLIVSLFDAMIFLELVQVRLQALLILQIVLQEDVFLGLRSYEGIFDC